MGGNTDDRFDWDGKAKDINVLTAKRNISPGFITTYGLHLVTGRDFDPGGQDSGSNNILINQSFARLLGGVPLGRIIRLPADKEGAPADNFTVIGVVGDYVYNNMYDQPQPVAFFCKPFQKRFTQLIYVRLRPGSSPRRALAKMESIMQADNRAYPFKYVFVDDQFNQFFQNEQQTGRLARLFAVLAVLISCLGLFGLAAYTAERRVKEIGIRKVLGASVLEITGVLSKDFLRLVAFSCLLAFPVAAWIMHDWLANYSYRIGLSPWVFLLAGVLAVVIAFFTIGFQTIRAALANPVKSLRTE